MTQSPTTGEQAALAGYRWQYDQIAERVYNALIEDDFVGVRLVAPDVGQADDLVLFRRGRVDAYQFRTGGGPLTFKRITTRRKTRSGRRQLSLVRSLAEGWKLLKSKHAPEPGSNVRVRLVTDEPPSVSDQVRRPNESGEPAPRHFAAFLNLVLDPLRLGLVTAEQVDPPWRPALKELQVESGLDSTDFSIFVRELQIDCNVGTLSPAHSTPRTDDIRSLSGELLRHVSTSSGVVSLNRHEVLDLMGWTNRTVLRSRHEFPVDLDTYEPLADAVDELRECLNRQDSGYVALLGPPGSGKSTLLSQTLTGTADRVIRYFAFIPGYAPARSRLTAQSFLHDLVLLLGKAGLRSRERQLVGGDLHELRQQLAEQLDDASKQYEGRGVRTIIVVDGLDHVDREKLGDNGLLTELPRPGELPSGVVFLVGSRTLAPLRPEVRQFLEETPSVVNLEAHRLPATSVLAICRRLPTVAALGEQVQTRIADLSDGHPLYLNYLLRRVSAADADDAEDILSSTPPYQGDIAGLYRAAWEEFDEDDQVIEILGVCSRLRVAFSTGWLSTWAPAPAIRRFRRNLLHLFHRDPDGWRFFHDSFRQFTVDRTVLGDGGAADDREHAAMHARIADLCAQAADFSIASEQLYHRNQAGQKDKVIEIGTQRAFRDQYQRLRSEELIREDIGVALGVAAEQQDLSSIIRLLLSLTELESRRFALRDIAMPGLLYESGLVEEAISGCAKSSDQARLSHAYDLAWRLGRDGNSAGRRIFESIAHLGVDERDQIVVMGHEDDAAVGWTRCAALYRPLPLVLDAIAEQALVSKGTARGLKRERDLVLRRYASMMKALIEVITGKRDLKSLESVDAALAKRAAELDGGSTNEAREFKDKRASDLRAESLALTVGLRVRVVDSILGLLTDSDTTRGRVKRLLSSVSDSPVFPSTRLHLAEMLASEGLNAEASNELAQTQYETAMTVDSLSGVGDAGIVENQFRYWRLRYLLAAEAEDVRLPSPPSESTLAEDDNSSDVADRRAIQMTSQIDGLVRDLARIDGESMRGVQVSKEEAWSVIERSLTRDKRPPSRGSATLELVSMHWPDLARIAARVASSFGRDLAQRMSDEVTQRLDDQRMRLPLTLLLDAAESLQEAGAAVVWERDVLAAHEASLATENVHLKLDENADLIRRHVRAGRTAEAQRLVLGLRPASFGVGFRKDYQFDDWVDWLGRAVADPGGEELVADAAWLARLLTAVEPMAEWAPRRAAAELPASVVSADPIAAVRIFEYLVRRGTVGHLDAVAALIQAILERLGPNDERVVRLAADAIAELLASAAYQAYPELASALVAAAERTGGPAFATDLADSIAARTDANALLTSRWSWRSGLGLPSDGWPRPEEENLGAEERDTFSLLLSDGTRIAENDVPSRVGTADDIVSLRSREDSDSNFRWAPIISETPIDREEVTELVHVFPSDDKCDPNVIVQLAIAAERSDDSDLAVALAREAFNRARGDTWAPFLGGTRLGAAEVLVRCGDMSERLAAFEDLGRQAIDFSWLPAQLVLHIEDLARVLGVELPARSVWSSIQTYLEGMAQVLDLDSESPLEDNGCRWWLSSPASDPRIAGQSHTAAAALAELLVGHLSHPSWIFRDTALAVVIGALGRGDDEVAQALARLVHPDSSDDLLECAGRCLAGARVRFGIAIPACLQQLDQTLAAHPNQALRDLASVEPRRPWRDLEPAYRLRLSAGVPRVIDRRFVHSDPYEMHYQELARALDLDLSAVQRVATRHATLSMDTMPSETELREALKGATLQHVYLRDEVSARRAGFGHVVADLKDVGALDILPDDLSRLTRTADLQLLGRMPQARPLLIPDPPPAGIDQTGGRWLAEIEDRLQQYSESTETGEQVLVGARSELWAMTLGRLVEHFVCGTTIGTVEPAEADLFARAYQALLSDLQTRTGYSPAREGEPLVVENHAHAFQQRQAEWLAFRPDLARSLGWSPDPECPGRWFTAEGDLAVESIYWADGFWGRTGRSLDDTAASGYVVLLTREGVSSVGALGEMTLTLRLARSGNYDSVELDPKTVTWSQPLPKGQ